jgi:acyl-CoA thioesterase-1
MDVNKIELPTKRKSQTWRILLLSACVIAGAGLTAAETKTVIFFGDSLTAGYGLDPDEAFPALIQKKIDAAGIPAHVVNAGLSGETTAGGLRRLNWILRQKVDVFVIELGANDGLRGIAPDVTRNNLQAMIDQVRAKYPHVVIVLAGMQLPTNLGPDYTRKFAAIFPELATSNHLTLIPFLLAGVGGVESLNQGDGMHPTAQGDQIVADTVWKTLEPLLNGAPK